MKMFLNPEISHIELAIDQRECRKNGQMVDI